MRDRLMRRKKKDVEAEKTASEQPQQAPLQPDFYEAQGDARGNEAQGASASEEFAPSPAPTGRVSADLPPIDDDNRWNRIDADMLPPPPRAAATRSFDRPRRQASQRAPRSAPPADASVEKSAPEGRTAEGRTVESRSSDRSSSDRSSSDRNSGDRSSGAEGREGPGRGRRRRGRRGRGRAKPEVAVNGAAPAPLRPSTMSPEGMSDAAPRAAAPVQDPAVPKKYKGVVVLSIGLPGSGKSSWFKRNNITPLSSDLLRGLLFDDPNEQRFQDLVFSNLRSLLRARLVARRPMNYVDATNLSPHERQGWIKLAHDYAYEVHAVYFDVPLEVCLERNRKRQRVVAEDVMRRMGAKLQAPTFEEGFTKITNVRVKKKEGEGATPESMAEGAGEDPTPAEIAELRASADAPEEMGVSADSGE